jgi:hypothetical protein
MDTENNASVLFNFPFLLLSPKKAIVILKISWEDEKRLPYPFIRDGKYAKCSICHLLKTETGSRKISPIYGFFPSRVKNQPNLLMVSTVNQVPKKG